MIDTVLQAIISVYKNFYLILVSAVDSYGMAAILLSVFMSFLLVNPLRWANKIMNYEHEIQRVITPQISKIKSESIGAEQLSRINALYSRYTYHPIYATRLVTGLFIQLPIFILTLVMFIGLDDLSGQSFIFINDLGKSDGLLYGNGNLLPFLMTAVNLAAAVLTPNFTKKDLKQAVGVSLLFFILLYNAKAILLIYWTTNNLILLLRNLVRLRKQSSHTVTLKCFWRKFVLLALHEDTINFTLILFSYAFFFSLVLTYGHNWKFTNGILLALFFLLIGITLIHLFYYKKGLWFKIRRINSKIKTKYIGVTKLDCLLILIPLAPVVQYALLNHDILPVTGQLLFIGIFAALIFSLAIVLPYILQRFFKLNGLVSLGIALAFIYISMPSFTSMGAWTVDPDISLLISGTMIIYFAVNFLYVRNKTLLYTITFLFFTLTTASTSYSVFISESFRLEHQRVQPVNMANFIAKGSIKQKPDIYLLTYDAYVGQKLLQRYGIDNSAQERYLTDKGFKIYSDIYSVGYNSLHSMSRVLDVNNQLSNSRRNIILGQSLVNKLLKQQGYNTSAVLKPYFYPKYSSDIAYDRTFPHTTQNSLLVIYDLIDGVNEGRFRFDLDMRRNTLPYKHSDWIAAKRKIFSEQSTYPKFLYTHTGPGHSQNSGKCLPNETALYEERLGDANLEMQEDINAIVDSNRSAIIIINGDHGPYLTGDCTGMRHIDWRTEISQFELQDRLGTFLAIKWPEKRFEQYDNFTVIQQVFEGVFKYLYDEDIVLKMSPSTKTLKTYKAPEGLVNNSKILYGKDKGKLLFED